MHRMTRDYEDTKHRYATHGRAVYRRFLKRSHAKRIRQTFNPETED